MDGCGSESVASPSSASSSSSSSSGDGGRILTAIWTAIWTATWIDAGLETRNGGIAAVEIESGIVA